VRRPNARPPGWSGGLRKIAPVVPGVARSGQGRIAVAFFLSRSQSMKIRPLRQRLLIVATKRFGFEEVADADMSSKL